MKPGKSAAIMPSRAKKSKLFRKKCRFCREPLVDSEIFDLRTCDQDKLANWWETMLKIEYEESDIINRGNALLNLVCLFCVSEARFYHEQTNGDDSLVWWNLDEPLHKYFRDQLISPCTVRLTKLTDYTIYTWTSHDYTNYWTCFLCSDKKFATLNAMYLHIWTNHKEHKIKCYKNGCFHYFKTQKEMEEHFGTSHNESKNMSKCVLCSKVFFGPKKKYLESNHMKRLHSNESFRCLSPNCCRYFPTKSEMEAHVEASHKQFLNKKKMKCLFCNKEFYEYFSLRLHMKTLHKLKAIFCPKRCESIFATHNDLEMHIKEQHSEKKRLDERSSCFLCGMMALTSRIAIHMRMKHPKDAFKCKKKICNVYFRTKDEAEKHFHTHAKPKTRGVLRAYQCDICNLQTSWKHNMELHFQIKHFPKTIKCADCKKMFATKNHLNEHCRKTHSKNRKKCPHCGMTPALYNSHVVTTKCFKCFKEFECFTLARAHRGKCRLVFQCDLCLKKSKYEQNHIHHFRTVHKGKLGVGHWMGAKKYKTSGFKCNTCKIYFPHEGYFNNHMRYWHKDNSKVNCHFCGAVRRNKKYLECHIKQEHSARLKLNFKA